MLTLVKAIVSCTIGFKRISGYNRDGILTATANIYSNIDSDILLSNMLDVDEQIRIIDRNAMLLSGYVTRYCATNKAGDIIRAVSKIRDITPDGYHEKELQDIMGVVTDVLISLQKNR